MADDLGDIVALQLEALALAEASMRCSIIWAGDEYPCVGGPEVGGKRIDDGGYRLDAQLKIKVRTVNFPEGVGLPQEKQLIQYKRSANSDPKTYRIDAITNWYDAILQFDCTDPAHGG